MSQSSGKARCDGNPLILIVNGDAKPIKEADQPEYLPRHSARQTLEFCNGHGRFPTEAVNLHAEPALVKGGGHDSEEVMPARAGNQEPYIQLQTALGSTHAQYNDCR